MTDVRIAPTDGNRTRLDLARISLELRRMYEGDQMPYLLGWLAGHIKDPSIRRRYVELAVISNVIRFLVDRVATLVLARVVWIGPDGKPSQADNERWCELSENYLSPGWDAFTPHLDRETCLHKTVVAGVEWDAWNGKVALATYNPAEIDVDYTPSGPEGRGNMNLLEPDRFRFMRPDFSAVTETWDFSNRGTGVTGLRQCGEDVEPFPVIDPVTGRSAIPFVPFRTLEKGSYFIWDGQDELRVAQEFVNRLYTRVSVLAEMGVNKTLTLAGNWADSDGQIAPIPMDISKAIKLPEPANEGGPPSKMEWIGPQVAAEIDSVLKIVLHWIQITSAQFGISPRAVFASNEPSSGYSLQIEDSALAKRHKARAFQVRHPLTRLVNLIRLYWNHYGPADLRLSETAKPRLIIPDYSSSTVTSEEANAEQILCTNGLARRLPFILKHEPSIPFDEALELADRGGEPTVRESMTGPIPGAAPPAGPMPGMPPVDSTAPEAAPPMQPPDSAGPGVEDLDA